jgi:hypothetical protein
MKRVPSLVASFFSSCTGGHRPLSMPAADRPLPDTSGPQSLAPSHVQIGIASWDGGALRPTVSGNIDDLDHATTSLRTVPLRTHAVGTPVAHGHAVRVRSSDRGPHTRPRILDLASEAARQGTRVHADVAQVQVASLAAAPPLAQCPVLPGDLSPEPWHTPLLFQLLDCNLLLCRQERTRIRAACYKYKVNRTSKAGCQALLRRSCYGHVSSWGCRDRRQKTPPRVRHASPTRGVKIGRMVGHPSSVRMFWKRAMSS